MATDSPHDKLFQEAFSEPQAIVAELRSVLPPAIAAHLDLSTLVPVPGSFIDQELRRSLSDLLFSVRFDSVPSYLYVLFEHKSEVDRWITFQILRYMVRIWERELAKSPPPSLLPLIIPILVHHGPSGWTAPLAFHCLFDETVVAEPELQKLIPDFTPLLDDLSHKSDEELRARALGAFPLLALLLLRDARSITPEKLLSSLLHWADLFRSLVEAPDGQRALSLLFSYLARVAPELSLGQALGIVRKAIPETEDVVATLAESLLEQGRNEGLTKGIARGQRGLLLRLLERKFGCVDTSVIKRLDAADEATLLSYAERVISASALAEVFED